jgi:putative glutamine amidotransferase
MRLIGLTGPSSFSDELKRMAEEFFQANFVLLYHDREENLNHWLSQCHGIVLAGGVDIHPSVYGHNVLNNANMSKFDIQRDNRELHIIECAVKRKMPLLGICRGHQLLGVYHGMPLIPDISTSTVSHNPTRSQITLDRDEPIHSVKLTKPEVFKQEYIDPAAAEERKIITRVMKQDDDNKIWVNSFHHQGIVYNNKIEKEFANVRILGTARADVGNVDHIVELMDGPNWLSCQWHPEHDWKENSYSKAVLSKFKTMIEQFTV